MAGIEATTAITTPIAATAPKEAAKTAEAKPQEAPTTAAPTTGDSVAQATPTEAQAKKVDVTA